MQKYCEAGLLKTYQLTTTVTTSYKQQQNYFLPAVADFVQYRRPFTNVIDAYSIRTSAKYPTLKPTQLFTDL